MKTVVFKKQAPKQRNFVAKALAGPQFRTQIVRSQKQYSRKGNTVINYKNDGGHLSTRDSNQNES